MLLIIIIIRAMKTVTSQRPLKILIRYKNGNFPVYHYFLKPFFKGKNFAVE